MPGRPVRLIGVGLSGFAQPNKQLGFWQAVRDGRHEVDLVVALDRLRDKFGERMIRRASDLHYQPSEDNRR